MLRMMEYAIMRKCIPIWYVVDVDSSAASLFPGNIGYADLDRLPVTRVDERFDKFKNCSAIIFDDRGYPQGVFWQLIPLAFMILRR